MFQAPAAEAMYNEITWRLKNFYACNTGLIRDLCENGEAIFKVLCREPELDDAVVEVIKDVAAEHLFYVVVAVLSVGSLKLSLVPLAHTVEDGDF